MPVKQGPVPPFPEGADPDEYDRLRRRVLWKMPSGLYVVGSTDKGERRNGMTLNWATQVSFEPKWLGVSVEREAFTHELIEAARRVQPVHHRPRGPRDRPQVHQARRRRPRSQDAERASRTSTARAPARPSSRSRSRTSSARCASRSTSATTRCSSARSSNAAFLKDEETEVLRMEDTRMNYGG